MSNGSNKQIPSFVNKPWPVAFPTFVPKPE